MAYTLVKFSKEDDALGIVPTNWLSEDRKFCLYPCVGSDNLKHKMVLKRDKPAENWIEHPITLLKEFSSYSAARSRLSDAEHTSNIESESEDDVNKPRKKIVKTIRLPGESSSDEESVSGHKKRKKANKQASTGFGQNKKRNLFVPPLPRPPLIIDETEQSQSLLESSLPRSNPKQLDGQEKRTSMPDQYRSIAQDSIAAESCSWLRTQSVQEQEYHSQPQTHQENNEIQKLKENQTAIWGHIGELTTIAKSNSDQLALILSKLEQMESKEKADPENLRFLSLLPVGIEEFLNLNEKINGCSSFRRNLIRILMTCGGKDARAMVANIMRKTISDDVGERYSLTGKQFKNGPAKLSFEKTSVYKVIIETCFRIHKGARENVVREAISDWLMQSKFRKNRREKRKNPEGNRDKEETTDPEENREEKEDDFQ